MAITYHAGRRIQGVASTVTNSTTGGAFVDVVFDASTEIGSLTYSGNTITRSVDSYSRSAINANFQFNNTGTQQLELVAQKTGTSAWFHFGLASAKCVDVGATGNASSQFEYAIRSADDGRTWIRQSSGAWTQVSDTADNSDYKIVNDRTTVTYYANGSSIGTTTHATPNAKYYPMIIVAQTGVDGSYALDYSGDIITTTTTVKPTNVQVGSRFEETDTRKMYQYIYDWFLEGTTWTFTDDLSSSTPWTSVGSGITVTGGEISMAGVAASGSNYLWRTLDGHTLSDTLWTMEFDYKSTGQSGGSVFFPFGVKSSVSPLSPNSGNSLRMRDDTDNSYLGPLSSTVGGADSGSTASIAWTEGSFYYPRIGRTNSTTMKYQLFSDAARTTQVGSTLTATISSSITGLDTLVCGGGDGGGGTSTGKISNIYISESDLFT
jgi:hypothetical protein